VEISRNSILSSGRPHSIKILSGENTIRRGEVAQIVIQVVDEQGIPVMLSDDEITCQIHGDARLLGLEASNNEDMTDYTDNKHRVFHGRLIAYIKADETEGDFQVKFSGHWLESAETKITVR
jgi:hypothetical protein